jgi:hypothetical protein
MGSGRQVRTKFALVVSMLLMECLFFSREGHQFCPLAANISSGAEHDLFVRHATICTEPFLGQYQKSCMELLEVLPSIGLKSPMRSERRAPGIIFGVVDSERSSGFRSQVCSLPASGIKPDALVFVCLDVAIAETARRSQANVILLNGTLFSRLVRYCLKFVIDYVLTRLGFESFLIDSDIIFFGEFLSIWNFETDIEVVSDWAWPFEAVGIQRGTQINTGMRRCSPKPAVASLFLSLIRYANEHKALDSDQPIMNTFLHRAVLVSGNRWKLSAGCPVPVTYSYVDPFKVPCGALLLCKGRDALCSYCMEHGILSPIAIHLNWHPREFDKARTLSLLNLTCPGPFLWPFWRSCRWPKALTSKCNEFYLRF